MNKKLKKDSLYAYSFKLINYNDVMNAILGVFYGFVCAIYIEYIYPENAYTNMFDILTFIIICCLLFLGLNKMMKKWAY
jgi:L-asparagine transporter-like permease